MVKQYQKTRSVNLSDEVYERIRCIANANGISISACIRMTFLNKKVPAQTFEDRALSPRTASSSIQDSKEVDSKA